MGQCKTSINVFTTIALMLVDYAISNNTNFHITSPWCNSIHILNPHFQERILLVSADVDSNPGPISDHKDEILEAISSCKTQLFTGN